jgi:AraC-like DNA-binding protein
MRRPVYHEHELFHSAPVFAEVHELTEPVELHGHDFCEIAVVSGGSGRHVSAQGTQELRGGDVVVLRPGAWHGFTHCRKLIVANCCVSAAALRTELAFLRTLPSVRDLLWLGPVASGAHGVLTTRVDVRRAEAAVDQLGSLERQLLDTPSNRVALFGALLTVLGNLVAEGTPPPTPHPAVASAVELLEESPERQWRLDELADAVGLDPAYLSRLFRRHIGLAPMAYLARVRAETAAALLARTDQSAARIGGLVGWPDPTYFARRFRALTGLTPTDYRTHSRMTAGSQVPTWVGGRS